MREGVQPEPRQGPVEQSSFDSGERSRKVLIPLFGTGKGMLPVPREDVLDRIIRTFVAASKKRRFCPILTVAVPPKCRANAS